MIIAFEVLPSLDPNQRPILTGPLECNANPSGLSIEPKSFKIGFKIRDQEKLEYLCEKSRAATEHIV
jgi:phenylacetate 2-hydroxylase